MQNLAIFSGLIFFAYFSWRKIEYGIYAIVFCLPLYMVRLNIFGIPSTALELGIYILFIIWLAKNYRFVKLNKIIPDRLLRIGIFLLLAGALISTVFSHELKTSAGILKGWFFDPLLFFVILVSIIKNCGQATSALKVFSISGLAVAAVSLFYWLGFLPNGVSYDGRLSGIYVSPNHLAMYLAAPFIIAVWFFLKNSLSLKNLNIPSYPQGSPTRFCLHGGALASPDATKNKLASFKVYANRLNLLLGKEKYFWLVSAFVMAAAIYFTYSYAAWLALFILFIVSFYFLFKETHFRKKVLLFAILLFAILLVGQSGTGKFENLKNLSYRSSVNSRLMIWRSALAIGRDYPVLGIGPGNFQKYYLDYQSRVLGTEPYLEWAVPQPHNIFLAFWLQTGILGLAGFIVILFWFFKSGILILKKCRLGGIRDTAIILLSAMAYILLHGLFDTTYWKNDLAMIFWLILGLAAVVKEEAGKII